MERAMRPKNQNGYSIIEMLVVLAIIGVISLVTVPNFIQMMRSSKMRTSLRQFTSDVRACRQRAAAKSRFVKLSFTPAAAQGTDEVRTYEIWDGRRLTDGTIDWGLDGIETPISVKQLDKTVYFFDNGGADLFLDQDDPEDGKIDIVFQPNGTLVRLDASDDVEGTLSGDVYLRSDQDIPYNQYQIEVESTGRIRTTESHF